MDKDKKVKDELKDFEVEYDFDCDCDCENKMSLALKIGIGVAAVAAIGSMITFAILKKKKSNS